MRTPVPPRAPTEPAKGPASRVVGSVAPPVAIRVGLWIVGILVALYAVQLALGLVRGPSATQVEGILEAVCALSAASLCAARAVLHREERAAWGFFAAGSLVWSVGDVYYVLAFYGLEEAPFPSLADLGYVGFYPLVYAGLVLLLRSRLPKVSPLLWVDGLTGALAAGAVGAAVLFAAVVASTGGPAATVAVNLAYPLGDLVILSLVVGAIIVAGRESARAWGWIAAGLVVFSICDAFFLAATADGYVHGALFDAGWSAGIFLIAVGAWRPVRRVTKLPVEGWRTIVIPIGFALVALAVLFFDHFDRTNILALVLAEAAMLAVLARLVLTFGDNVKMLRRSRQEALTDALTGLANRRRLTLDLGRELSQGPEGRRVALAVFDLDGFKGYNDTFGHPAGDALLRRLGRKLADAVEGRGTAYRMGGDEFCLLAPVDGDRGIAIVDDAVAALSEQGESFSLGCSQGTVLVPEEASEPAEALRIADQRLYRDKFARRGSPSRQTTDALLRALSERHPTLDVHVHGVGDLAEAVARRLGLGEEELEHTRLAGELHDIGKMAIPDAILEKPEPLNEEEWAFMRRHTIIGERITNAAPALSPIGRLVRASHERYDGGGYPDGMAGEDIPLAARIVCACDAYDAMVSDRPYRGALTRADAMAELRDCAGGQFDPSVVEAVCAALEESAADTPDEPATERHDEAEPAAA